MYLAPQTEVSAIREEDEDNMDEKITKIEPEGWEKPLKILAILAHPDDPEFFCGATIARWAAAGHSVNYCLLTRGDKGAQDPNTDPTALGKLREVEQRNAADRLGVNRVFFLDYQDGYLVPSLETRLAVTRVIRQERPDILVSSDPTQLFGDNSINHPDHRAAGQIVVDAVFPASGNPLYFPELLHQEGLQPHSVKEVWLAVTGQPNTVIDVTEYWEQKIHALHCHVSQIGDMEALTERMRGRHTPDSTREAPRYEERFRRLKFR